MRNLRRSARESGIVLQTRLSDDHYVCVSVTDHGPGVAKGLNDAVFNPFVSTKSDGLGVGLAISKTIIEAHDGAISYSSPADGGARFEARFPVAGPVE
jgi:two-component system sensor kinase FixL